MCTFCLELLTTWNLGVVFNTHPFLSSFIFLLVGFQLGSAHQLEVWVSKPQEMVLKSLQKVPSPMASIPMSRRIVTAGGGAHRLAQLFMDSLTVEVVPFKEMVSQLKVTRQTSQDKNSGKV